MKKNYIFAVVLVVVVFGLLDYFYSNKKSSDEGNFIYKNATSDLIKVELPFPGAVTGKEFSVIGKARGTWYFEASFPVKVLDKDGKVLFRGPAQAQGEWMTQDFVPFKIDIKVPQSYVGPARLVLENDNPSGLPENEKSISFDFIIEY